MKENGLKRNVTIISCPTPKPQQKVSIAMSIDVSGSMSQSSFGEIPVELGKTTARELCNFIAMPPSEFALQICNNKALIVHDFTISKNKILSAIEPIRADGGNDFVEQLLNPLTGLLNVAKAGKHKRVAILYTDAWWYALKQNELQQCKDTCSKYKIQFFSVIYSRPEAEPNGIKKSLQELADYTGGFLFDGITSLEAAKKIGNQLQQKAHGGDPCTIEWESGISCVAGMTNVEIKLLPQNTTATISYQSPNTAVAKLEFNPSTVRFQNPTPGVKVEEKVTVTARNSSFTVTNITSNNGAFEITPKSFVLNSGQSREITVSYIPADSGYNYCKFEIENNICPTKYYASGGWKGKKPTVRTIKLIHPNGGEVFIAGSDTVITREGVPPDEPVKLEYRTDDNQPWITISDTAKGFSHRFRVPKIISKNYLARITAKGLKHYFECDNPDVEICGKIWMGCNLDVKHYRNGDPIRHAKSDAEWIDAKDKKEGAWCYYNNSDSLGRIYGKLYNWYAVNDPRGLAPEGWHVATDAEWTELVNCLGGSSVAGGKLKSTGTIEGGDGLWKAPNAGATNETGFSAIPGGYRYINGAFRSIGSYGYWWSAPETSAIYIWGMIMFYNYANAYMFMDIEGNGFSVRCVRD